MVGKLAISGLILQIFVFFLNLLATIYFSELSDNYSMHAFCAGFIGIAYGRDRCNMLNSS